MSCFENFVDYVMKIIKLSFKDWLCMKLRFLLVDIKSMQLPAMPLKQVGDPIKLYNSRWSLNDCRSRCATSTLMLPNIRRFFAGL